LIHVINVMVTSVVSDASHSCPLLFRQVRRRIGRDHPQSGCGDARDEELFTFVASFGRHRGQCAAEAR
jgi:hypothetical protein